MRGMSTLLVTAALAAAPATTMAQPCGESHTSLFEATSMGKGRLGVVALGITPELRKHFGVSADRGVLVARVEAGSPAAVAGLQPGDIITDAGTRAIDDASDLVRAVSGVAKGQSLELKLVRDHEPLSLSAKLTSDPIGFMDFGWLHEMMRRFEPPVTRMSSSST